MASKPSPFVRRDLKAFQIESSDDDEDSGHLLKRLGMLGDGGNASRAVNEAPSPQPAKVTEEKTEQLPEEVAEPSPFRRTAVAAATSGLRMSSSEGSSSSVDLTLLVTNTVASPLPTGVDRTLVLSDGDPSPVAQQEPVGAASGAPNTSPLVAPNEVASAAGANGDGVVVDVQDSVARTTPHADLPQIAASETYDVCSPDVAVKLFTEAPQAVPEIAEVMAGGGDRPRAKVVNKSAPVKTLGKKGTGSRSPPTARKRPPMPASTDTRRVQSSPGGGASETAPPKKLGLSQSAEWTRTVSANKRDAAGRPPLHKADASPRDSPRGVNNNKGIRCERNGLSLYDAAEAERRRHDLWVKGQLIIRAKHETQECPFKPTICEHSRHLMQSRVVGVHEAVPRRAASARDTQHDDVEVDEECVFHPTICPASRYIAESTREAEGTDKLAVEVRLQLDGARRGVARRQLGVGLQEHYASRPRTLQPEQVEALVERLRDESKSRVRKRGASTPATTAGAAPVLRVGRDELGKIVERLSAAPTPPTDDAVRSANRMRAAPRVGVVSRLVRGMAVDEHLDAWHSFIFEERLIGGGIGNDEGNDTLNVSDCSSDAADAATLPPSSPKGEGVWTVREHVVTALLSPPDWTANSLPDLAITRTIIGALSSLAPTAVTATTLTSLRSFPLRLFADKLLRHERLYGPQQYTRRRPQVATLWVSCPTPPRRPRTATSVGVRAQSQQSASRCRLAPPPKTSPRSVHFDATVDYPQASTAVPPQPSPRGGNPSLARRSMLLDELCADVESLLGDYCMVGSANPESHGVAETTDIMLSPMSKASAGCSASPTAAGGLHSSSVESPHVMEVGGPMGYAGGFATMSRSSPPTVPLGVPAESSMGKVVGHSRALPPSAPSITQQLPAATIAGKADARRSGGPPSRMAVPTSTTSTFGGASLLLKCASITKRMNAEERKRELRKLGAQYAQLQLAA